MKGATAVSSATLVVNGLPNQPSLRLVNDYLKPGFKEDSRVITELEAGRC